MPKVIIRQTTPPDGTVNVNKSDGVLISSVTVASGGTEPYNVADSTAVLKDTDGTTISTTPIKATESEDIVAPDVDIEINGVTEGSVVSGGTAAINLVDGGGDPVTPESVTVVGDTYTVEVPSGGSACPIGAKPIKTGQLTSYASEDDGDTRRGRLVDFYTLNGNNAFGNTNRFTDLTGGQTYAANSVFLDHSTDDGSEVLAFTRPAVNSNWLGAFTIINGLNTDDKTDWFMPNRSEMELMINEDVDRNLNWSPLNVVATPVSSNFYWWTCTTPKNNVNRAKAFFNSNSVTEGNQMVIWGKSNSALSLACRYYTYAELGL
jgi:hypothetical protein